MQYRLQPHFKRRPVLVALALSVCLWCAAPSLYAEITIVLNDDFVEQYKLHASITADFTIDKAHARPNTAKKDGDMHVAGRSDDVGLPIVAEIMNAKYEKPAVDLVHDREGTGSSVTLSGAWRLWCEHGGDSEQRQGEPLQPFTTTNPDHVFEIHPVTSVGGIDVTRSLTPITGYEPKEANQAFTAYENVRCEIDPTGPTTTITTTMAGYNYVEFQMELIDTPLWVDDGAFAFASVRDLDGELIIRKRRMVFLKDTPPYRSLQAAAIGDRLHVLGIPRISLSLVSWRAEHAATVPDALTWNLPYEIMVAGVYRE